MARLPLTDNRLTIADLARDLDKPPWNMGRSAIQRFDGNADVQRILNKDGELYPAESLQWWKKLAEARQAVPPLVSPATAGRFLDEQMNNPVAVRRVDAALTDNRQSVSSVSSVSDEDNDEDNGDNLPAPVAALVARMSGAVAGAVAGAVQQGVTAGVEQGVEKGMERIVAAGLVVPADRLLTLKEAREQTGMAESTIREVTPVVEHAGGRRKWLMSALQARLREFARSTQQITD